MTDLAARYAKAESWLPHNVKPLITSLPMAPTWIDGDTCWYRKGTGAGHEFVLVDAAKGTKEPAFDHDRLAKALSVALETEVDPGAIPLTGIDLRGETLRVTYATLLDLHVDLTDYSATVVGLRRLDEALSPDGRWAVSERENDLWLRNTGTDEERRLTTDGVDGWAYGSGNDQVAIKVMRENLGIAIPPQVVWAPDSSRFITHRIDQREVGLMHLVRSAPFDGGRPRKLSYHYALPGDEKVATAAYLVFEAATGARVDVDLPPFDMPFVSFISYGWVWWHDESTVHALFNDRGDHNSALRAIDATTGAVRTLVEDRSESQILYGPQQQDREIRSLSTGEVLWWSQRADWAHLYLYGTDGSVRTLTSGAWGVRHVVLVDETARRVVFTAGGHDPGADLYLQQLCTVSLDGGPVTAITTDGLDHHAYPSPSGAWFVDSTSRWDTPMSTVLRDRTGAVALELEQSDASALYATGWNAPERAVVKAADGVTDVYCSVYRPHGFDPSKSYPVLDCIYPGPQMSCSPQRFPLSGGPAVTAYMGFYFPDAMAALGFVVVTIDGRGSAMRERSFQDHSRNPACVFVDDHVTGIQQLGQTRPWMDLERVGVYGYSAGGFGSTRCILQAPDFYKVCVSGSGNHDNRVNHSWWGEKYFGLVEDFDFAAQANASLAENLEGRLFLLHGEMDDNATPHGTMRLVDALIRANKDFDLLIIPNADHFMMVNREYFVRRRWDYLVQHLLGETPPAGYRLADMPLEPPV